MDAIDKLKQDVREGRIGAEALIDLVANLCRKLEAAQKRIEELEKELGRRPSAKLDEPFSTRAEDQRQEARGKKKRQRKPKGRRGRLSTDDKVAQAERTEAVFPEGVPPDACYLSHVRPVWRLENGRAVLIAYQVYRGPGNRYGRIPGVLGRSEYGLEIITEIAYLVYIVGLSFDKVCLLLNFFQNLRLGKSQANALLYRLSRDWEHEFDLLCTLLANSLVVHADETSWSLNSVWAFLSEKARVILFGVHKDGATLKKVLDPASFAGIVISDDAAVYADFTESQKCWAHLLRKAIKLTLQDPNNTEYRGFTDRLLEIYRGACRVQRDQRLSDEGRARKVRVLDAEIIELCEGMWLADLPPMEGLENDYRLLVNELMRLMVRNELFTFVTAKPTTQPNGTTKPVDGTNNEAERTLRGAAQARVTGRTNKTGNGARRQTILTSVLESLRLFLPTFTLSSVLEELKRWWATGQSCFEKLVEKLKLTPPEQTVIDQILPGPSG
jgi:transposase